MGLGPSKSKIKEILQASCNDEKDATLNYNDCIPYQNDCFTQVTGPSSFSAPDDMDKGSESMSMIEASSVEQIPITNKISKVNIRHYPYCAIGTLNVIYPDDSAVHQFTCFLIEANVVVTLGTNISNPNHSGKATNITTSFSPEKVTNIIFPDNFDKNKPDPDLAVLIYPNPVVEDWVGVKMASNDELSDKDIFLMCSVGTKDTIEDKSVSSESKIDNSQTQNGESSVLTDGPPVYKKYIKYINNSEIHEVLTNLNAKMSVESNDPVLLQKCRGGPVYYKGYDGGSYVIGYLDKEFAVQQISKEAFKFLVKCVNEGKKTRKKVHKNIEEDKIYKLDLARNEFGPLDIKYLSEFDLINLQSLDLSSNAIKPQGAYFLSQGSYVNLRILNLNFNEIGDEGITHISNANFNSLEQLFLFHNNISSVGIKNLCKADFISNLLILSLSENPSIEDEGCKYIQETKNWTRLAILNLNRTGLKDISISYLSNSAMPNLKKIQLKGNNFTNKINNEIQAWKLTGLSIEYDKPDKKHKKHGKSDKGEKKALANNHNNTQEK